MGRFDESVKNIIALREAAQKKVERTDGEKAEEKQKKFEKEQEKERLKEWKALKPWQRRIRRLEKQLEEQIQQINKLEQQQQQHHQKQQQNQHLINMDQITDLLQKINLEQPVELNLDEMGDDREFLEGEEEHEWNDEAIRGILEYVREADETRERQEEEKLTQQVKQQGEIIEILRFIQESEEEEAMYEYEDEETFIEDQLRRGEGVEEWGKIEDEDDLDLIGRGMEGLWGYGDQGEKDEGEELDKRLEEMIEGIYLEDKTKGEELEERVDGILDDMIEAAAKQLEGRGGTDGVEEVEGIEKGGGQEGSAKKKRKGKERKSTWRRRNREGGGKL